MQSRMTICQWLLVLTTMILSVCFIRAEPMNAEQVRVAVEALKRLKGVNLEANPPLMTAVHKVLDSAKGTPQFVELVKELKIKGQEAALLEYAARHPKDASGLDAIRLVLANGDLELVRQG